FQHVAVTYDKPTGVATLYYNGAAVTITNLGSFTAQTSTNLYIGERPPGDVNSGVFHGRIDELSLYQRALSPAEIHAIYAAMNNGKFEPITSAPLNLAKARVTLGASGPDTFYGNNTQWLTRSISFTAGAGSVPLQVTGLEPGVLMDSFVLSQLPGEAFVFPE